VTNNLVESFNNWIKDHKVLNLDDFMDKIRQLIAAKWNKRRKVSTKFEGLILPHIIKRLKEKSRDLDLEVVAFAKIFSLQELQLSPAIGTRSKKLEPSNPAFSTRSKRRLSL
jgi:hypothetical protein